jgi:hypothetical protein
MEMAECGRPPYPSTGSQFHVLFKRVETASFHHYAMLISSQSDDTGRMRRKCEGFAHQG